MSSVMENMYASTLPLSVKEIKESAWDGFKIHESGVVLARIFESKEEPGYFHCRGVLHTATETKRPVIADAVGIQMDSILSDFGCFSGDLKWTKSTELDDSINNEIVYFLKAGPFIKIGKATGSAESRISQLQTGCPFPISVMATVQGGCKEERRLHRRFKHLNSHGEWFHAVPELLKYVATLTGEVSA